MIFTIAKNGATITGTTTLSVVDHTGTTIPGAFATTTVVAIATETTDIFAGASTGKLVFVADNEQQVTTSETYSLKANIGGTLTSGKYISVSIANPTTGTTATAANGYSTIAGSVFGTTNYTTNPITTGASFVWTDRSANSHSESTSDWLNDFKVMNLPLDTQTMTGSGS